LAQLPPRIAGLRSRGGKQTGAATHHLRSRNRNARILPADAQGRDASGWQRTALATHASSRVMAMAMSSSTQHDSCGQTHREPPDMRACAMRR